MSDLLPIAVRLNGRRCLVVGGGAVATKRITTLVEAGATVEVVAPKVSEDLLEAAASGRFGVREIPFAPDLLDGVFLVVAATDDPEVNAQVVAEARARGILCNNAGSGGTDESGDVVIPAVVRRGDLVLSVTTCGASPAFAESVRRRLAELFGPEYAPYVRILGIARERALEAISDPAIRTARLRAMAHDPRILALVQEGREEDALTKALACILSP